VEEFVNKVKSPRHSVLEENPALGIGRTFKVCVAVSAQPPTVLVIRVTVAVPGD
jgi:hypothetical protein